MSISGVVEWNGADWLLGIGFDSDGRAREVFVDGVKVGSDTEAILDDACIVISILLQGGMEAAALAGHLGREGTPSEFAANSPHYAAPRYASPIGMVAASIAHIEMTGGQGIREAYLAAEERGRWPRREAQTEGVPA